MRRYIIPSVRQPRPNDKLGRHRTEILRLREEGYTFKAIGEKYGVTPVAIFNRVHQWAGRLKANKRIDWDAVKDERSTTAWSEQFEDLP